MAWLTLSVHASADGGIVCADTIEDLSALNQDQAIALVQAGMDWDSCADPVELAWGLKVLGATLVLIPAFEGTEVVVASVSGSS